MASIDTGGGGGGKKGQPKRLNLRVDFTPMVDMNMLLITFFMFCTTLSKPQTMDLVMPTKDKDTAIEDKTEVEAKRTLTVLLGEDNKIYYYEGEPDYNNYNSLKETNFSPEGLRSILLERNQSAVQKMKVLRTARAKNTISEEEFKKQSAEIKSDKAGQVVIIKPTDFSSYKNLVDILDEMQICSIGKYAIVDLTDGDEFLLENYRTKGSLSDQIKQ